MSEPPVAPSSFETPPPSRLDEGEDDPKTVRQLQVLLAGAGLLVALVSIAGALWVAWGG